MKPLKFIGSSADDLAEFPREAKGAAGYELWQVQLGLRPSDWKPMLNLCGEIRRCGLCVARLPEKDAADTQGRHRAGCCPLQATQGECKMKTEEFKVTDSCGNVFVDLGFSPEEATILAMRSQLMGELRIKIRDMEWTQAEAAKVLGISQSRVSDLIRGKFEKFSLDMLITLATRAGKKVELKLAA
jgi:predicted XRE-type DNA-binding protein